MLGVVTERSRLCSVCVDDVVEDAEWVSSVGCVALRVGASSRDVEATGAGAERFPAARGALTFRPLEAALPGGESLAGAALFVSEMKGRKSLALLSGIGKYKKWINI